MATKKSKVIEAVENAGIETNSAATANETHTTETTRLNRPKGRMLSSAASFWPFEEKPVFQGYPLAGTVHDPKQENKLVGYNFVTDEGEPVVIGATGAIQKALNETVEVDGKQIPIYMATDCHIYMKWCGKVEMKNGNSFNKFETILLEE